MRGRRCSLARGVEGPDYAAELVDIARDLRQRRVWVPAPAIAHTSGFRTEDEGRARRVDRRPSHARRGSRGGACLAIAIPFAAAQAALSSRANLIVESHKRCCRRPSDADQRADRREVRGPVEPRRTLRDCGLAPGEYVSIEATRFSSFTGQRMVSRTGRPTRSRTRSRDAAGTITLAAGPGWPPPPTPTAEQLREIEQRKANLEETRARFAANRCPGGPSTTPAIGGNIRQPMKFVDVRPVYPASLASTGTSGKVLMRAAIDTDGNVPTSWCCRPPIPDSRRPCHRRPPMAIQPNPAQRPGDRSDDERDRDFEYSALSQTRHRRTRKRGRRHQNTKSQGDRR